MRSPARLLISLYPAHWRERYGEEFEALLEDSPPSFSAVFDLMTGAIKMRLSAPSFPKLALLLSLMGLVTGWGISLLVPNTYISQATLQLAPKQFSESIEKTTISQELAKRIGQMQREVISRTSLASIITDPRLNLYQDERKSTPLEEVIETMRTRDLRIFIASMPGERRASAFSISFAYRDAAKAHDTVQRLITGFQEANLAGQRAIAASLREHLPQFSGVVGENLDVLDPPSLPAKPAKPNHAVVALWGFGAGFLMAILIAIFRRPARPAMSFPAQPA